MTQAARHVLSEVLFAQRQLPTAVACPGHKTNPDRKRKSVDKVRSLFADALAQDPTHPADCSERYAAPHVLCYQRSGIATASSQTPSQNRGHGRPERRQTKHKASRQAQIGKAVA